MMTQFAETGGSIGRRSIGCRLALSAGIVLLAAACTTIIPSSGPPTVIRSTPFGSQVVSGGQPVVQPNGTLAAPPAGLEPNRPAAAVGNRSGVYSGTAVPLNTAGGLCISNRTISGFKVDGNAVRWGRFRGTIAADNGLQMVNGNTWVLGQFVGDRFDGQMSTNTPAKGPGCSFMMSLTRTSGQ